VFYRFVCLLYVKNFGIIAAFYKYRVNPQFLVDYINI